MHDIPETLDSWTLAAVQQLIRLEHGETDRFDFKASLATNRVEKSTQNIRKAACSFANSHGGFLIFGVSEAGLGAARIVGIPADRENAKALQDILSTIEPSIEFRVKDPPIALPNANVLFVVEFPAGVRGPHWDPALRKFYKRGKGTCIEMTHEELRTAFTNYEERLNRIKLVYLSLVDNWIRLEEAVKPEGSDGPLPLTNLDLAPIRTHLAELQALCPESIEALLTLLRNLDAISTRLSQLGALACAPFAEKVRAAEHHKREISHAMGLLQHRFNWILELLVKRFQFAQVRPRGPSGPAIPPVPCFWRT